MCRSVARGQVDEQDSYNPNQWHHADENSGYPPQNYVTNTNGVTKRYCVQVGLPAMGCPDYTLWINP
jgi:hypothetical protein